MRVVLTGWRPGLLKISLNDLLREKAGYSLKQAKDTVDDLLDDKTATIRFSSREEAVEFLQRAASLGAEGRLVDDEGSVAT